VERNDRLARARTSLYDEHPAVRSTNDFVLLRLDRGDDVTQLSAATLAERGEQRAVPAQRRRIRHRIVTGETESAVAEGFVFDREQTRTVDHEVPAAHETHRLATRCPVEGLGDRSTPVDDDGIGVAIGHRQAPDVECLGVAISWVRSVACTAGNGEIGIGVAVDAPEHKRSIADVEMVESGDDLFVEVVALVPLLERSPHLRLGEVADPQRAGTRVLEAGIGPLDVRLLGGEIRMLGHTRVDAELMQGRWRVISGSSKATDVQRRGDGAGDARTSSQDWNCRRDIVHHVHWFRDHAAAAARSTVITNVHWRHGCSRNPIRRVRSPAVHAHITVARCICDRTPSHRRGTRSSSARRSLLSCSVHVQHRPTAAVSPSSRHLQQRSHRQFQ
jgi:hypothetical protein